MAGPSLVNPYLSPLAILEVLKALGPESMAWKPEVLFSRLDPQTDAGEALESFHSTGEIKSAIPPINRHKIFALRIIMTSDTAHTDWHVFEKIGGAFNGRLAHFGVIEPLSPLECVTTVALINAIRPDIFSGEITSYVAASCHLDGFYTLLPCKWLSFAEAKLQEMNQAETARPFNPQIAGDINSKLDIMLKGSLAVVEETFTNIQAMKLLALNKAGEDAIAGGASGYS